MAVGECACVSVHGANRLGSNSLLDLVVFGRAAGLHCAETLKAGLAKPRRCATAARTLGRLDKFRHAKGVTATAEFGTRMQRSMQLHAAVFRRQS